MALLSDVTVVDLVPEVCIHMIV